MKMTGQLASAIDRCLKLELEGLPLPVIEAVIQLSSAAMNAGYQIPTSGGNA